MRPRSSGTFVWAGDVYESDKIPVLIRHVLEADITENTGIVDEDIDATESLDGSIDDLLAELDRVVVGYGLSAGSLDLVNNDICGLY
jgi:hypothetical protein